MTIPPSVAINTLFPCAHLPLRTSSLARSYLPSRVCPRVCYRAFAIAGLRSRSTRGQSSLQDFARDPPVVNPHRRTSLAIHPWSIIIAGLRSRYTRGQSSSQDFACAPPLAKYHRRTSCARFLIIWQSTLGQSSSHDCRLAILRTNLGQSAIAPSVPNQSAIYPSSPAP